MNVSIKYKPTPKQLMFHTTKADVVLYGGAAGGGKSKACVMDAFMRCMNHPNTHAYMFRRTYGELEDTLIKEAKASIPTTVGKYNTTRHEMTLINGSVIHFCHCASDQDVYNYQGTEMHWLYIDELTHFTLDVFNYLRTRVRAKAELNIKPVVRCTSNPGGVGHGWVKKMFVDAAPYMEYVKHVEKSKALGQERTFLYQYIPALVTENPYISKDYVFELENKPKALRDALLYGHWDAFEGQCFPEWTNDPNHYFDRQYTHVIKPFHIPLNWPRYMSFDHGYSEPFSVGWWAVDPDGRLYRYKEWYGCDGQPDHGIFITPREIAQGIIEREREERDENLTIFRIADPAIFDKSRGDSVADMMRDLGGRLGIIFNRGDNNRMAGKMQFHQRLRFREDGKPMLYVFDTCRDFIRTIPALPYSMTRVEDVDTKAEDHCLIGTTPVVTDEGVKLISALCNTDGKVLSSDGQYHRYFDARKTQTNVPVFKITFEDGTEVVATKNHRFMRADGTFARLDELVSGNEMRNSIAGSMRIAKIEPFGTADVYNMEVETTHDFVLANGVVAHNCYDDARYMCMGRPLAAVDPKMPEPKPYDPFEEVTNG